MLKDTWVDRVDNVDDVAAEDINRIAHAVIELEQANGDIDAVLDDILEIQDKMMREDGAYEYSR